MRQGRMPSRDTPRSSGPTQTCSTLWYRTCRRPPSLTWPRGWQRRDSAAWRAQKHFTREEVAMVAQDRRFGVRVRAEVLVALLRIALGVIFVVGGIKLALLGDTAALAASYSDLAKGWIAPVFQEQITQRLGLSVGGFLR